jgi:hypothetical protein
MSSSVKDIFSEVQTSGSIPGPASTFGSGFDFTKAIQGEGIPPLQLPNGGTLPQPSGVTTDPSGGLVQSLPAQLGADFGPTATDLAIGPRFPGGDVRRFPGGPLMSGQFPGGRFPGGNVRRR